MPPKSSPRHPDDAAYLHSWKAFDKVFAAQPMTSTVTRPSSPAGSFSAGTFLSRTPHTRPMAPEPFATPGRSGSHASTSSWSEASGPVTPNDSEPLDDVWARVRQQKTIDLEKVPSKVQSLETWSASNQPIPEERVAGLRNQPSRENTVRAKKTPRKKRESEARLESEPKVDSGTIREPENYVRFHESADGRRITAIFDLGVPKENMDIAFRGGTITITWLTVYEEEHLEGVVVYRERKECKHIRTIPVPDNTKLEEIVASSSHGKLYISYPKARAVRVKARVSPRPTTESVLYEY